MIAEGMTNAEIGAKLWVSEEAIKSHVRNLLRRQRARNRTHLVTVAYQRGLLSMPSPRVLSGPGGPSRLPSAGEPSE